MIAPLLLRVVITPVLEFDTPAPKTAVLPLAALAVDRAADFVDQHFDRAGVGHPGPADAFRLEELAPPPLIAPLLVSVAIVPEFDTPAPPIAPPEMELAAPPSILPLLVSVVILPELDHAVAADRLAVESEAGARGRRRPDRAAVGQRRDRARVDYAVAAGRLGDESEAGGGVAAPPVIAPPFVSVMIVPALYTPAPPTAPLVLTPPAPPLIAPLLVSVLILPMLSTPAPPTAPPWSLEKPAPPPIAAPLMLFSFVIAPELNTPAPPAAAPLSQSPRRR